MKADPKELEIEEMVQAWAILAYVAGTVEARQKELRIRLLAEAEEFGRMTEKGGQRLLVESTLVQREKRVAKLPNESAFKELMNTANIGLEQAFSKATKTVLDPSKVENLVNLGKLKTADVERLKKVTWALRVKPSSTLDTILDEAFGYDPDEEPFDADRSPREKRSNASGPRKG